MHDPDEPQPSWEPDEPDSQPPWESDADAWQEPHSAWHDTHRPHHYILDANGDPQPCASLQEWAQWYETSGEQRKLAHDEVNGMLISTVFLSLDHAFGGRLPLLYETMVFAPGWNNPDIGMNDQACERYHTKAEALAGHALWLARVEERARKLARN